MSNIIDNDTVINLSRLISQPLISTLEADFYTARRFFEFLTDYGLEESNLELINTALPSEEGDNPSSIELSGRSPRPLQLKMVTFLYQQIDPVDRREKLFTVQVPLITLIPLPLLQIERAEFDFNLRIYSEIKLDTAGAKQGALLASSDKRESDTLDDVSFQGFKARLSPSVGRTESGEIAQTLDANMKVKVQMRQADLPGGLAYWLSALGNATSVRPVPYLDIQLNPSSLIASDPTPAQQELRIIATVVNERNIPIADQIISVEFENGDPLPTLPRVRLPEPRRTDENGIVEFAITIERATPGAQPSTIAEQRVKLKFVSTTPAASKSTTLVIPEFTA